MSEERKQGFIDKFVPKSADDAMKMIFKGLILAVLFGTLLMTSRQINGNSGTWENIEKQKNQMRYWRGEISAIEFTENEEQIELTRFYMQWQYVIFGNIFRALVNVSLIYVVVGFAALSKTHQDEKVRSLSIAIAGVVLFVLILTTFFSNIAITLA